MRLFNTAAFAFALVLCACAPGQLAGVAGSAGAVAVANSTATPTQAKDVAEATLATTLAERTLDLYVTSGHADAAVLRQLKVMVPAVHNALKRVQVANAAGNNALAAAALAAFNEAVAALQSYEALKGIK